MHHTPAATHKITLPIHNPKHLLNTNTRKHWTDRSTKTAIWRPTATQTAHQTNLPKNIPYAVIHAHIYKARAGRYDPSNLYPTVKAIVDGLMDYGLLPDDDYRYLDGPHLHHGGFDKTNPRIELTIHTYQEAPHAR